MATRFYLPTTGAAAVNPAYDASWEDTSQAGSRIKMVTAKIASAFGSITATKNSATNPYDILARQYVSDPIVAQTITGTLTGQLRCSENFGSADAIAQIVVWVVSNDGTTVRGTLMATTPTAGSAPTNEFVTSLTNRPFPNTTYGSATLSSVAAQDGDRLVVEVGSQHNNTTNGTRNTAIDFGDNSGTDLAADSSTTTQNNPWVEFSQTIVFQSSTKTVAGSSAGVASSAGAVVQAFAAVLGVSAAAAASAGAAVQAPAAVLGSSAGAAVSAGAVTETAAVAGSSLCAASGQGSVTRTAAVQGSSAGTASSSGDLDPVDPQPVTGWRDQTLEILRAITRR